MKLNSGDRLYNQLKKSFGEEYLNKVQLITNTVDVLDNSKPVARWVNKSATDNDVSTLSSKEVLANYKKLIFQTNYQQNAFRTLLGVPFSKSIVIETGITPVNADFVFNKINTVPETINIVYTAAPQRGLQILVPVFKHLRQVYPTIRLHVFCEYDETYKVVFDECRNDPDITYHGFVSNSELTAFLATNGHIYAYPCIWEENSCTGLIEAMSAGMMCVHSNLGALPDISGGTSAMYNIEESLNLHAGVFANYLASTVEAFTNENNKDIRAYLLFIKEYADRRYNWNNIQHRWKLVLDGIIEE